MVKPSVWLRPGIITIYGASIDAECHSHHAIQIIWKKDGVAGKLNDCDLSAITVINSGVTHQLEVSEGWVLLVEPKSYLGEALTEKLADESIKTIEGKGFIAGEAPDMFGNVKQLLTPLFQFIKVDLPGGIENPNTVQDKRILLLLNELNQCLGGSCNKPVSWRANEVASQLALSESRFLHLFRDEMGIAWRPYLLWRRMMCAVQALTNNVSATEAAHLAGFSDSAHLSRTFRSNFGMSIRQAFSLFKN